MKCTYCKGECATGFCDASCKINYESSQRGNIVLPYKLKLRSYQKGFYEHMRNGGTRAVLVWNRRAGKDKCTWNWTIEAAIKTVGTYYYIFPTFAQARKVIWDARDISGMKFLDHVPKVYTQKINNTEMKIELKNGSIIQLIGSDKYDSIMGTNPVGCVFSEYALQDPAVWQLVRPILDANGGWAVFIFTPRGSNHAKEIFDTATEQMKSNPNEWYCSKLTLDDTKVISLETLQKIRDEGTSEDYIQQEWYCSFTLGIMGAYYANYIENLRRDERITELPHDPHVEVHTAWDRGFSTAAITFFQMIGKEIHIIDHYETHEASLKDHIKHIKSLPYGYGQHFVPHDMDAHEYSLGMSAVEVAAKLGIQFTVLPREFSLTDEEGIEAARSLFPRMWVDETKCKKLIKALENYHREYDEKNRVFKNKPKHDWASHSSDSFRYMAQAVKGMLQESSGISDAWVDHMSRTHNPRFT